MSKSKFVDFKAVKAAITMEQVLAKYGLLPSFKRSGENLSGPCPIHKGSNPTQFRVSLTKNVWNCFSECKHGGNTLDFIAKMDNVSIHTAAQKAVEWFQLDPEAVSADSQQDPDQSSVKTNEVSRQRQAPPPPATESAEPNKPLKFRLDKLDCEHASLQERGITRETAVDFGAGYCGKGMMAERIAIPIHNVEGKIVAYAGRWPGQAPEGTPRYKLPQGFRKSLELFNLDRAMKEPPERPWIVVEGFFGCMMLHQLGIRKVVALMGSSMSSAQEELIRTHTHSLSRIIVMLDEDEAGRAGREDVAIRLSRFAYVRIHVFGEEGRQPEQLNAVEATAIAGGAR